MADPRFVTNVQGERVGVILDLPTYEQMLAAQADPDLLQGLSDLELAALAESALTPGGQRELQRLQDKQEATALSGDEAEHLDRLIEQVDHLNLLKARARYTLQTKAYPRE